MKIEINNLGPIHHFEFDLEKDLHLLYGGNAIGKSYAVYCVYSVLKFLNELDVSIVFAEGEGELKMDKLFDDIFEDLEVSKGNKIDFSEKFKNLYQDIILNSFEKPLQSLFSNSFSSISNLSNRFSKEKFTIIVTENSIEYLRIVDNNNSLKINVFDFNKRIFIQKTDEDYILTVNDEEIVYGVEKEELVELARQLESIIFELIGEYIFEMNAQIKNIFFLPASRSGLYQALNSFTPILVELTKSRFFLKNKTIDLPSLPEPLSDYFINLSTVNSSKKNVNISLNHIVESIEQNIINGKISIDKKDNKIKYSPNGTDLVLDLNQSSSMIAEISPIVIFIKYILDSDSEDGYFKLFVDENQVYPKQFLIIEEPEAHLHPEIQVKLMEIFAELTKHNVKVILTSHSDFMLNKTTNMLLDKSLEPDKVGVYHMEMTDKGSVVRPDMKATEEGIEDHNFMDVSTQLYEERMRILENQNPQTNAAGTN